MEPEDFDTEEERLAYEESCYEMDVYPYCYCCTCCGCTCYDDDYWEDEE